MLTKEKAELLKSREEQLSFPLLQCADLTYFPWPPKATKLARLSCSGSSPGFQLIVIDAVTFPENEKVVLLITFAGFVFHIPVVFPGNLIFIAEEGNGEER